MDTVQSRRPSGLVDLASPPSWRISRVINLTPLAFLDPKTPCKRLQTPYPQWHLWAYHFLIRRPLLAFVSRRRLAVNSSDGRDDHTDRELMIRSGKKQGVREHERERQNMYMRGSNAGVTAPWVLCTRKTRFDSRTRRISLLSIVSVQLIYYNL